MGADSHMIRVQPNSARQQQHVAFACFRSSNAAPCALASPLPVYVDEEFQDGKALQCIQWVSHWRLLVLYGFAMFCWV